MIDKVIAKIDNILAKKETANKETDKKETDNTDNKEKDNKEKDNKETIDEYFKNKEEIQV